MYNQLCNYNLLREWTETESHTKHMHTYKVGGGGGKAFTTQLVIISSKIVTQLQLLLFVSQLCNSNLIGSEKTDTNHIQSIHKIGRKKFRYTVCNNWFEKCN